MPLITVIAKATPDRAMAALAAAVPAAGFAIDAQDGHRLTVRKGNWLAGAFLGFFTAYVVATVTVKADGGDRVRVVFEWQNAWIRGIIGPLQNPGVMRRLARRFEEELTAAGGELADRPRR